MNRIGQAHQLECSNLGLMRDAALCSQVRKGRVEKKVVSLEFLSFSHKSLTSREHDHTLSVMCFIFTFIGKTCFCFLYF